jgi:hypothetical protein
LANKEIAMKNVVLASVLSAVAGALVAPRIGGPVHYQLTQPHALYGELPVGPGAVSVSLGTLPVDFVLQDFVLGGQSAYYLNDAIVKVNGSRVLTACLSNQTGSISSASVHLTGGVFIPAGSLIEVEGVFQTGGPCHVTLAGYVQ